jgi:hypothetical protein
LYKKAVIKFVSRKETDTGFIVDGGFGAVWNCRMGVL